MSHYMRLSQLDRITELELGKRITGVKCLSLSENYLRDHFPRFPVMPGVLMLEAMYQASFWLVRATDDFKYSSVVLREGKSLKFQGFVQPGDTLVVQAEIRSVSDSLTNLKVSAKVGGLAIATLLRTWMSSLEYKICHYDITTDPARPEFRGRYIFVFWHEYITFPVTLWGNYDVAALVSQHRDQHFP